MFKTRLPGSITLANTRPVSAGVKPAGSGTRTSISWANSRTDALSEVNTRWKACCRRSSRPGRPADGELHVTGGCPGGNQYARAVGEPRIAPAGVTAPVPVVLTAPVAVNVTGVSAPTEADTVCAPSLNPSVHCTRACPLAAVTLELLLTVPPPFTTLQLTTAPATAGPWHRRRER